MATQVHAMAVISRTRSNGPYRTAVESLPGYVDTAQLRAKLTELQRNIPAVPPVATPEHPKADLDAWLEAAAQAEAAQRARDTKAAAVVNRLIWCDKNIESIVATDTDDILASLHADLTKVMEQVKAVAERLNGAHTPQQVIDAGGSVSEAWRELRPLRNAYDTVRTAQEWVMAGEQQTVGSRSHYLYEDPLATDLAIRNLDQLFPAWRDPDTTTVRISPLPDENDPRPWPQDQVSQLIWLATSAAEPGIPTITELNQLHSERKRRMNPEPMAISRRPDKGASKPRDVQRVR